MTRRSSAGLLIIGPLCKEHNVKQLVQLVPHVPHVPFVHPVNPVCTLVLSISELGRLILVEYQFFRSFLIFER